MEKCPAQLAPLQWWDRNSDGVFSVSDIWLILGWLFHLPGDFVVTTVVQRLPGMAAFLELGCSSAGGVLAVTCSVVIWLFVLGLLGALEG